MAPKFSVLPLVPYVVPCHFILLYIFIFLFFIAIKINKYKLKQNKPSLCMTHWGADTDDYNLTDSDFESDTGYDTEIIEYVSTTEEEEACTDSDIQEDIISPQVQTNGGSQTQLPGVHTQNVQQRGMEVRGFDIRRDPLQRSGLWTSEWDNSRGRRFTTHRDEGHHEDHRT